MRSLVQIARLVAVGAVLFAVVACDGEEEKYEKITKLRALGVSVDPIGLTPSASDTAAPVQLIAYVAAPLGATVEAVPYNDDQARYAQPIELTVAGSSHTDYAKLSVHTITASFQPPAAGTIPIPPEPGFARLRYGLRITSGTEEELVVGTLVLYADAATRPAYEPLTVTVDMPAAGTDVGADTPVEAVIDNKNDENVKYGWFVSSGELKNRRARKTEWRKVEGGAQTLIITARGAKSGAFAYAVLDVE